MEADSEPTAGARSGCPRLRTMLAVVLGIIVGGAVGAIVGLIVAMDVAPRFAKPALVPDIGAAILWLIGGLVIGGLVGSGGGCYLALRLVRWWASGPVA